MRHWKVVFKDRITQWGIALKNKTSLWWKHKGKLSLSAVLILLSIYLFFQQTAFWAITGIFLILVAAKLSEEVFRNFLKNTIVVAVGIFYVLATISWWNNTLLFGLTIDDGVMLVLVTILYVLLTYINLNSNKEQFGISRLSLITAVNENFCFRFINRGEFMIKNLIATIEINYPLPKNLWGKIISCFKTKKLKYKIPEIFPGEEEYLDFEKEALTMLPIKKEKVDGARNFTTNGEIQFDISLSFIYESDTGYQIPEEIKERYEFVIKEKYLERREEINPAYKTIRIQ